VGRPDLLAASPARATAGAGRRALARLRAADVHRVGELVRRAALRRLVTSEAALLDPLQGLDEQLEAALAHDPSEAASADAARRPRRAIEQRTARPGARRRAPLAREVDDVGADRRPSPATTVATRRHLEEHPARGATSDAGSTATAPAPVRRAGGRAVHAVPAALDAARHRPVGTPDPEVSARLAAVMPPAAAAATGPSVPTPAAPERAAVTVDQRQHRARALPRGPVATGAVDQPGRADPEVIPGSPSAPSARLARPAGGGAAAEVAGPAPASSARMRVVGLAGLAEHFDQQRATGAVPPDVGTTAGPTSAPAAVLPQRDAPRWSGDARAIHDDRTLDADGGAPASDLLAARRLADIIGDVISADARRHGIDLDGIHRP